MFGAIGTFVFRMRFAVIAVMIALMAGLGIYGLGLGKNLSQSGFFDDSSPSVQGSKLADATFGRDHRSDVILLITPPAGTTVDDPAFGAKVEKFVNDLTAKHPDVVNRNDPGLIDPFTPVTNATTEVAQQKIREQTFSADKRSAFISIGIKGNDDTTVLNNFKKTEPFFDDIAGRYDLPGTKFQLAGLQPIANAMSNGMAEDVKRAELIALPLVAVMLFFIFGGVVAAILPVLIGGLTIAGSTGIVNALAQVTEINVFAQPVISLIGLGIAIDYGLFIVSRFREELAEGYPPTLAVKRSVMTAGQTVVFSATIIIAALACLLLFPQGFLKSVAYGAVASVGLAALLSITVLPAILAILGTRIDMWGFKFLKRTKTRKEVEEGFWGKLASFVMRHPAKTAIPTVLLLLLLIIPFSNIKFGGITEKYLPPGNSYRAAQENFDRLFPTQRTEEVKLIIRYDTNNSDDSVKLSQIADEANKIPGFTKPFSLSSDDGALSNTIGNSTIGVIQMSAGLVNKDIAGDAVKALRGIDTKGLTTYVAGTPALTQDSIDALLDRLPLMAVLLILVTSLLMFLAFGSVVLPIKAALMSALGLGSTLGVLTWIFIDGHGASLGNFTPGPLMSAVLVLIIAIVYGLSTDYEVFLLSRMVEARQKGATTTEAIRSGTAHTGRIITAAAAILVVVTGAFGLSEIVMMKYIAYGMIAALILDATVIRMLLVPAIMKLLGDDCWWAPKWMQAVQRRIGLGETVLDDEPGRATVAGTNREAGTVAALAPTSALAVPGGMAADRIAGRPLTGPQRVAPARVGPPRPPNPQRPDPQRQQPPRRSPMPEGRPIDRSSDDLRPVPPPRPAAAGVRPAVRRVEPARETPREPVHVGASAAAGMPSMRQTRPRTTAAAGPDTGGWSLGDSGIRLGGAITNGRAAARAERAAGGSPPPEPVPANGARRGPTAMPVSEDRPVTPARVEPDDSNGRRHERGDGGQISVQELLRRNNSDR
ncbi:MMPL family transporter [Williamsia sp. CHRR-6]|uniref:MMPL family transporter n=1 Tax=Williamsia sp. CHRR-6 TaxID=2835871 RepID=UPI001BDA0936|nr:MMPL family transporter [Williamsia sp. CHRR-6]MBT0567492.1 MMPL family transporter [Williamsia sp. CHRR-6]